jgi:hypothetical protein
MRRARTAVAAEATLRRRGLPELDKPEYSGKIEDDWIVEKLLAQGGVSRGF